MGLQSGALAACRILLNTKFFKDLRRLEKSSINRDGNSKWHFQCRAFRPLGHLSYDNGMYSN